MSARLLTVVCALFLLVPSAALGQGTAPPGNSGVDEYLETLPGAQGDHPTGGRDTSRTPEEVLGGSTTREFDSLGEAGQAAAELAAETAPADVAAGRPRDGQPVGDRGPAEGPDRGGGGSGPLEVLKQLSGGSDSGGSGMLLPLILIVALLGAVAFAASRRGRTT